MEEVLHDLFSLDNILAAVLIIYIALQHIREVERSKNFFLTVNKLIDVMKDCQEQMAMSSSKM